MFSFISLENLIYFYKKIKELFATKNELIDGLSKKVDNENLKNYLLKDDANNIYQLKGDYMLKSDFFLLNM